MRAAQAPQPNAQLGTNGAEREAGSVLVLALLVTLLILGIGLTAMWVSTSGTRISNNLTRRQEALYAAETGLDRGRAILRTFTAQWQALLAGCGASMDDPADRGMILCDPTSGTPVALQLTPVIASGSASDTENPGMANISYSIFIRNDPFEYQWCNGVVEPGETSDTGDCNGDGSADASDVDLRRFGDMDRRVVLRVEGHGKDGVSQVAVEAVLSAGVTPVGSPGYAQEDGAASGTNAIPRASIALPSP